MAKIHEHEISESLLPTTVSNKSDVRASETPVTPVLDDGIVSRQKAIEREEHGANVFSLAEAFTTAALAWPCFVVLDWFVARHLGSWPFHYYLMCRAIGEACIVLAWWRLRWGGPIGARLVRAIDIFVFSQAAALVSIMCTKSGGLLSPYAAGIPVIMICRSAFSAQHWRDAVLPTVVAALVYPCIQVANMALSAPAFDQLNDSTARVHGTVYLALISCTGVFSILGGHARWSLRRQVFHARSVGRYSIVRKLGSGGMGDVWTADHRGLKRQVAIKILRSGVQQDPIAVRRFEREAHALSQLTHPNTVRIFDFGVTPEGLWYYAMELLDGRDLAALVREQGPLEPRRVVHLMLQVSRALAEAHERGIVHRDVKPENVFVSTAGGEQDLVKVLDFGIAKVARHGATLTEGGWFGGTPNYMSPEAARGADTDARSDVYSVGATMYFALTGRPPFVERNAAALLQAHLHQDPSSPSAGLANPLPPSLEELVLRCLSKDPHGRPADGAELARALSRLPTNYSEIHSG